MGEPNRTGDDHIEVAIIGAGWHGLTMAKTYHEAYPTASLRVLDSQSSIGGTWASERLYPGLKTNNLIGSYEFSDFPMTPSRYNLTPGQHIPGSAVHAYLEDAVDEFDIRQFIRLQTNVLDAELLPDGSWVVTYADTKPHPSTLLDSEPSSWSTTSSSISRLHASRLVVATGLTSTPSIPSLPGLSTFRRPLIHSKQLNAQSGFLSTAHTVAVIGCNKSAWDVCYNIGRQGGTAHMLIRPSGGGPSWVWPARFKFGLWPFQFTTSLPRLTLTRLYTLFDPWPFADDRGLLGWLRWLLHKSTLGRACNWAFWGALGQVVCRKNAYDESWNMGLLRPWTSAFWMGNSLSTHNYETRWFELVREGRIVPHIAEVEWLTETGIRLDDGEDFEVDAVVCCTGWQSKPSIKFSPADTQERLGLPVDAGSVGDARAQQEVHSRMTATCPMLRKPPDRAAALPLKEKKDGFAGNPYRLFHYIAPADPQLLAQHSVAFIGLHFSVHALILAQVQALWITAFFNNENLQMKSKRAGPTAPERHVVAHCAYWRLRRPRAAGGLGERYPDLLFESLPYVDMLLEDLGIRRWRKKGAWDELFSPYSLADYRGLVQEWKTQVQTFAKPRYTRESVDFNGHIQEAQTGR